MRLFTSILLFIVLKTNSVFAMSIDWAGNYRFEITQVDKPSLGDPSERKSYGLHILSLSPKIVAADGFNIVGRFNILNSEEPAYVNSQAGQIWGAGGDAGTNTQDATPLQVTQLYLHAVQEYGSLVVGRAPLHFGVGMTYNAGNGAFDHWYNSRDMAAYKFIIGNFYFAPGIARVRDDDFWQGNVIQEDILEFGYDAPDSNSQIAVMMNKRKGSQPVNSLNLPGLLKGALAPGTVISGFSLDRTNFLLSKAWTGFAFKLEGSFLKGESGVQAANGDMVNFNGYGIAAEISFPKKDAKSEWSIKAGMATGDDPATADYEGFHFDKNYDVAFLLFNHRLGRQDFLTTDLVKDTTRTIDDTIDDEAIGNVIYIAPTWKYVWSDRLDIYTTFAYAQTVTNPTGIADYNNSLGMELDIDAVYRPRQKVLWSNRLGFLMPGKAFENGSDGLSTDSNFGFESRIAISF
jgi:hypothetical protein